MQEFGLAVRLLILLLVRLFASLLLSPTCLLLLDLVTTSCSAVSSRDTTDGWYVHTADTALAAAAACAPVQEVHVLCWEASLCVCVFLCVAAYPPVCVWVSVLSCVVLWCVDLHRHHDAGAGHAADRVP